MRTIDEQFLESPCFGSRQMARWLRMHKEFVDVGRKRVARLYLNAYETGSEARTGLGNWIDFYNRRRPHSSLADRTPDQAYWQQDGTGTPVPTTPMAAA